MNEPLYVPATTNDVRPLLKFAWGVGLAAIPLAFIPEVGFMISVYAILVASLLGLCVRKIRPFVGRGVIVDEEGIAPSQDGERLWTLPWTRYGGYRWSRKKEGYEILDREGSVAFVFPGALRADVPAKLALREELDRRVPEGGFPFQSARNTPPSLRTALVATFVGSIARGSVGS